MKLTIWRLIDCVRAACRCVWSSAGPPRPFGVEDRPRFPATDKAPTRPANRARILTPWTRAYHASATSTILSGHRINVFCSDACGRECLRLARQTAVATTCARTLSAERLSKNNRGNFIQPSVSSNCTNRLGGWRTNVGLRNACRRSRLCVKAMPTRSLDKRGLMPNEH